MGSSQIAKTVLIADDDSAVRGMLGRLLRTLGWTTIEAADGCAALEKLSLQHIDLLILDQRMPNLTGAEVLSVVRSSATHANLPVIIITGASDPETSQAVLALGISDYLIKPFRPDFLRQRLARMDKLIRTPATKVPERAVAPPPKALSKLVVVDGEAEHRNFLKTVLKHRYEVVEAPTATAALRVAATTPPSVYLLGPDIGLMAPEFLARKLRDRKDGPAPRVVLVTPQDAVAHPEAFDGVIRKTLVPRDFLDAFNQVVEASRDDEGGAHGELQQIVQSAAEAALAAMTSGTVSVTKGGPASVVEGQFAASVDAQIQGQAGGFQLQLRCTSDHACAISGLAFGVPAGAMTAEDGLAALGDLAGSIAGRIEGAVTAAGGSAAFSAADTMMDPPCEAPRPTDLVLEVAPEDDAFRVVVVMRGAAEERHPKPVVGTATQVA